jgi:ribosomal protein S18 acetylase RimI-like enzyme
MPIFLHDKHVIEDFLRQNPALFVYELGDLDDFFWPYTSWIAGQENGVLNALLLLYAGLDLPVVLAQAEGETSSRYLKDLFQASLGVLPARFYSHLSPGLVDVLRGRYALEPHGLYLKMKLADSSRLEGIDTRDTVQLRPDDCPEVAAFYEQAYPGNWFDARMLETGCYYGIRREGRLISAAGIHVYSPQYRAAALGNITTLPEYRGQGLGTRVTARVCQALLETVDTVGLNVRADNAAAIKCYSRLGFVQIAVYEEWMVG